MDAVIKLSDNVCSIIVKLLHYLTIKFSGTLLNPARISFVPPAIFCFVLVLKVWKGTGIRAQCICLFLDST